MIGPSHAWLAGVELASLPGRAEGGAVESNPLSPDGLVFGPGGAVQYAPPPQAPVPEAAPAIPAAPPMQGWERRAAESTYVSPKRMSEEHDAAMARPKPPGEMTVTEAFVAAEEADKARAAAERANKAAAVATVDATPAAQIPAPAAAAPPAPAPAGAPPGAPPAPEAPDVQYAPIAVGGHPAGEAHIRGPQQEGHLLGSLEPPAEAAARADFRNQLAAQHEEDLYAQQADQAIKQQEALERAAAKRQQELAAMQQDYRDSVDRLGSMSIDTNRAWANKSTPEKIATSLLVFLGGVASFGTGQRNPALDRVMSDIDRDVDAQKFDYQMAADTVKAKQTAYGQMFDRYQSEDAAAAAAKAAGIDATMAKVRQLGAQWKGTESANAADDMLAKLAAAREQILADGFRFVPAASGGQRYQVSVRGQLLPGTVSEAEAQQIALKHGAEPAERTDEALVKGGIEAQVAQQKNQGERANKTNEETRALATEIQKAGIPKLRALVTAADTALTKSPGGIPEAVGRSLPAGDFATDRLSPDAAAREEAFAALQNASWHDLSGGAITPTEETRLKREGAGISNPAGRQRWIQRVRNVIGAAEDNLKAGASDEARAEYERRQKVVKGGRTAMPGSFTPHGEK